MPMSEDDKKTFAQGRPYVVGLVALVLALRDDPERRDPIRDYFDVADSFIEEFEKRNEIKNK